MGLGQTREFMATDAQSFWVLLQQVPGAARMRLMAGQAVVHGGAVGMRIGQPRLDVFVAGQTKVLDLLCQEVLFPPVMGRVAGNTFLFVIETMGGPFIGCSPELFVTDLAECPSTTSMEHKRIGCPVVTMAPLAVAFLDRRMGRG